MGLLEPCEPAGAVLVPGWLALPCCTQGGPGQAGGHLHTDSVLEAPTAKTHLVGGTTKEWRQPRAARVCRCWLGPTALQQPRDGAHMVIEQG